MGKVGLVVDSTCDLGPEWLAQHDIVMVPLKVLFGDTTYLDWIDLTPEAFYEKLSTSPVLPKTSQPSPADFSVVYSALAEQGCDEIVSIHLTAALSGTFESATLAATGCSIPVRVIDTHIVSAGYALVVQAALDARDAGGDGAAIEMSARHIVDNAKLLFALDTLDYLVKGGRAGKAQGLAASLLNIKPVLTFNSEGTIEPFKKVKGTKKALAEIAGRIAEASRDHRVQVSILHSIAPQLAEDLRAEIDASGANYELLHIVSVGAVIGTYAGPGAVGAVYCPVE